MNSQSYKALRRPSQQHAIFDVGDQSCMLETGQLQEAITFEELQQRVKNIKLV